MAVLSVYAKLGHFAFLNFPEKDGKNPKRGCSVMKADVSSAIWSTPKKSLPFKFTDVAQVFVAKGRNKNGDGSRREKGILYGNFTF